VVVLDFGMNEVTLVGQTHLEGLAGGLIVV
jgi:hypothetical protein